MSCKGDFSGGSLPGYKVHCTGILGAEIQMPADDIYICSEQLEQPYM